MNDTNLWAGLTESARKQLKTRKYEDIPLETRLGESGVEVSQLLQAAGGEKLRQAWIPGVEIFPRTVYPQRQRGVFGELAREGEGILSRIGLRPRQWSAARMFAGTAKGFHVHPPSVPRGAKAAEWHQRQFETASPNYAARRYDEEQWDVMFVLQGTVEFILHDLREGLPRRTMRFTVEGDDRRGPNNAGLVIPPGVAHALRAEGSSDVVMIYGTSTTFRADWEGRLGSEVEDAPLPSSWDRLLQS